MTRPHDALAPTCCRQYALLCPKVTCTQLNPRSKNGLHVPWMAAEPTQSSLRWAAPPSNPQQPLLPRLHCLWSRTQPAESCCWFHCRCRCCPLAPVVLHLPLLHLPLPHHPDAPSALRTAPGTLLPAGDGPSGRGAPAAGPAQVRSVRCRKPAGRCSLGEGGEGEKAGVHAKGVHVKVLLQQAQLKCGVCDATSQRGGAAWGAGRGQAWAYMRRA